MSPGTSGSQSPQAPCHRVDPGTVVMGRDRFSGGSWESSLSHVLPGIGFPVQRHGKAIPLTCTGFPALGKIRQKGQQEMPAWAQLPLVQDSQLLPETAGVMGLLSVSLSRRYSGPTVRVWNSKCCVTSTTPTVQQAVLQLRVRPQGPLLICKPFCPQWWSCCMTSKM